MNTTTQINNLQLEIDQLNAELSSLRELAADQIAQIDEDGMHACKCCGMELSVDSWHRADCLAVACLSSNRGQGWASPEDVKVFVKALSICQAESEVLWRTSTSDHNFGSLIAKISDASVKGLAHAKSKGLTQ